MKTLGQSYNASLRFFNSYSVCVCSLGIEPMTQCFSNGGKGTFFSFFSHLFLFDFYLSFSFPTFLNVIKRLTLNLILNKLSNQNLKR